MLSRETQDKLKCIIGEEAFANFMNKKHDVKISEDKNIIISAFTWDETEEGHKYWNQLDNKVREKWYEEDESDLEITVKPKEEEVKTLPNTNISRRDYFAAMVLQGIISGYNGYTSETATNDAIRFADTLISKLDKNNE